MNIAQIIRLARIDQGITQKGLGNRLEVSESTICRLESGKIKWKWEEAISALEFLNLTIKIIKIGD